MAERVLVMAEKEQGHRHSMESIALNGTISRDTRGQRFGLAIALFFGLVSLAMAFMDRPVVAGIIGTVDLVAIVSIFVLGRRKEAGKEPDEPADPKR